MLICRLLRFGVAESRNDGKIERFYFLQKQKVAKTLIRIRTSCGFYFFWIATIRHSRISQWRFFYKFCKSHDLCAEVSLGKFVGCVATSEEIRLGVYWRSEWQTPAKLPKRQRAYDSYALHSGASYNFGLFAKYSNGLNLSLYPNEWWFLIQYPG